METEKLKFKIELYATAWNKPPIAEIKINEVNVKSTTDDDSYFKNEITGTKDNPTIIEFEHTFENEKSYTLDIIRTGKDGKQTIIKNNKIIKDQLLHIKYIEIDEIDIGALIYEGIYTPIYPEPWTSQQTKMGNKPPETIKNSPDLGHNGTWSLSFSSPFYMWLLENLY